MSVKHNPTLRIDWFDGTVIEEATPNTSGFHHVEDDAKPAKPPYTEKKLMGFKKLFDLSQQEATNLTLQLSGRSSFWDLLNSELKDDYIVLICKILANLYTSLRAGQKSIMLTNLLNSRFLTSKFLDKLSDYILSLPNVRIVEKKMNMQFWDDVEAFYRNVLAVCDGISVLSPGCNGESAMNLLEAVRASVNGLMEEHKEQFTEELFLKMDRLENNLRNVAFKGIMDKQSSHAVALSEKDATNFRNLNIFPTREDLLGTEQCEIKQNIVNGAYASVDQYLDIQFKLLREDYFGPLREGISKYLENPKQRLETIRVHPKVRIIRTYVSNNKVGYLIDIAWRQRSNLTSVNCKRYASNKQLMFGSLLLFTSDGFHTLLCATVLDSSSSLLRDGYLAVTFIHPVSSNIFSEAYQMVENEVFFEPYHRVLRVLQSCVNDVPMKRYIVDVQSETRPPSYLTDDTIYTLPGNNDEISFPVLDLTQWPSQDQFGLDESQMDAFKLALTREFAAIQGPPGTGKTFIGVKVATTLLHNLSLEGTPMLVICYTNHSLDQFLEGILKATDNIVRLGSQSKNPKIEPYTLNNLRTKSKSKHSYLYNSNRQEQEKLFQEMIETQICIEKCEREILTYDTLKSYLTFDLKQSLEDPVLTWLFGSLDITDPVVEASSDDDFLDDWERQFDEESKDKPKLESCFSEQWALKEIDSMLKSVKYAKDIGGDHTEGEKMADKFQEQIDNIQKRLYEFKKFKQLSERSTKKLKRIKDPYALSPKERWIVYNKAVSVIKEKLMMDMNDLQAKHLVCAQEQEEIATLLDAEVMRTIRVVGATTTSAARRHDLLQTLRSPIVIIEEAAEVMEAHIVASLTHHCQHVIMIGDHKQLRPTASNYRLAKDFNLEVSLFERMLTNGVHARSLSVQRRMRPSFVELLVPTVYERLDSHSSVLEYNDVRGLQRNLFFVSHEVQEDGMTEEIHSYKNPLEARWCVELAKYLRCKNYGAEEIVILATYSGQAGLIKESCKDYEKLRDIKITAVDNYQGEESRIVILSLVRSNRDGKIGFLAAQNRVCVALSRAKEGFYIFGNMNALKSASPVWNAINDKLESQRAIGKSLALRCDVHADNVMQIDNPYDLDNSLSGTCLAICHSNKTPL